MSFGINRNSEENLPRKMTTKETWRQIHARWRRKKLDVKFTVLWFWGFVFVKVVADGSIWRWRRFHYFFMVRTQWWGNNSSIFLILKAWCCMNRGVLRRVKSQNTHLCFTVKSWRNVSSPIHPYWCMCSLKSVITQ